MINTAMRNHYAPLQLPAPGPRTPDPDYPEVDVALVMESTYPYLKGGVSAVVHDIIVENPSISFGIIHISWDSKQELKDLYGMPENVKWVKVIYLSLEEHKEEFAQECNPKNLKMNRRQRKKLVARLMSAFDALIHGDVNPLWSFYDEGINPRTRTYS